MLAFPAVIGEHAGMRSIFRYLTPACWMFFAAIGQAQTDPFLAGTLREGMKIAEVVAVLGEPQARFDKETLRGVRLVYPKRSFDFLEGRLLRPPSNSVSAQVTEKRGKPKHASAVGGANAKVEIPAGDGKSVKFVRRPDTARELEFESVLSEVVKSDSQDTARAPRPPGLSSMSGSSAVMADGTRIGRPPFGRVIEEDVGGESAD